MRPSIILILSTGLWQATAAVPTKLSVPESNVDIRATDSSLEGRQFGFKICCTQLCTQCSSSACSVSSCSTHWILDQNPIDIRFNRPWEIALIQYIIPYVIFCSSWAFIRDEWSLTLRKVLLFCPTISPEEGRLKSSKNGGFDWCEYCKKALSLRFFRLGNFVVMVG